MTTYKAVPNFLRQYRLYWGFSQRDVANYLGLKDTTLLSRWEHGDAYPSLVSLIKLSTLYEVSIEKLFTQLVRSVPF